MGDKKYSCISAVQLWARCLIFLILFHLHNNPERYLLLTYYRFWFRDKVACPEPISGPAWTCCDTRCDMGRSDFWNPPNQDWNARYPSGKLGYFEEMSSPSYTHNYERIKSHSLSDSWAGDSKLDPGTSLGWEPKPRVPSSNTLVMKPQKLKPWRERLRPDARSRDAEKAGRNLGMGSNVVWGKAWLWGGAKVG